MYFYLGEANYSPNEVSKMLAVESLIRTVIYFFITVAIIFRSTLGFFSYDASFVIALCVVILALAVATLHISRKRLLQGWHTRLIKLFPFVDVIFISALVYLTGGIDSKFLFLYLLPSLTLLPFSFRHVLRMSAISVAAYLAVVAADYYNLLPEVSKPAFTIGQLAIINSIRLGLAVFIVTLSVSLLLAHFIRTTSSRIERRISAVSDAVGKLGAPLEETHAFLYRLRALTDLPEKLYKESQILQESITEAIAEKDTIMEASQEPVPIARMTNLRPDLSCQVCGKRIGLLGRYYAVPPGYRFSHDYGEYENELHCEACHLSYGEHCLYCEVWS